MARTRTIVDHLKEKTMPQFKQVAAVERDLKRNLPVIKDSQADIDQRAKALEQLADRVLAAAAEVKEQAQAIGEDSTIIDTAICKMLESQDTLAEFVEKLAQYSTLVINLKEVFFKADPKILKQVLEEIDPEARREAWQGLDPPLRAAIAAELKQVK